MKKNLFGTVLDVSQFFVGSLFIRHQSWKQLAVRIIPIALAIAVYVGSYFMYWN
jgi:hypothetical protein